MFFTRFLRLQIMYVHRILLLLFYVNDYIYIWFIKTWPLRLIIFERESFYFPNAVTAFDFIIF